MTAIAEWGPWQDQHTIDGVAQYSQQGLRLATPQEVRGMDPDKLEQVARDCGAMLAEVYRGTYPMSTGDAEKLVDSIRTGETHLYTLSTPETLVGMAALVGHSNPLGGPIKVSELGRACGVPLPDGSRVSLGPFLKYRVPHALDTRPDEIDFFVSSTRAAAEARSTPNGEVPSGRGVQSVWWGGRKYGGSNAMLTTYASWKYRLGDVEPFNSFVIPADPEEWAKAVNQTPLYVDTEWSRDIIKTLLTEGSGGKVQPNIIVRPDQNGAPNMNMAEVAAPSAVSAARFVVTEAINTPHNMADVDERLADTFSQETVVEADIATTPRGATAMRQLREAGWTLVGWEPSNLQYGAICPVYARVNPSAVPELLAAHQHPEYFDEAGLSKTRTILGIGYASMVAQASK